MKSQQIAIIMLVAAVGCQAADEGAESAADEVTITVGHNRIDPTQVSITAGNSVSFHNVDEMPGGHTIVADDNSFESPPLGKDETWTHQFPNPGTYPFHIVQHPDARGTVSVEEE